jgi:hypothetical protein
MSTITLEEVKKNQQVLQCIAESDKSLDVLGYTEHGIRHVSLVSERAGYISDALKFDAGVKERAQIAAFCHDMGNFMGRTQHHYWGALLFHQIFSKDMDAEACMKIVQAIANHDKEEMKFTNPEAALVVIADKSDVHRSRVRTQSIDETRKDIHDRVNYATTSSELLYNAEKHTISLILSFNTHFLPIMGYFEIFTERMTSC